MNRFAGKIILVAGATSGIGRATAIAFGAEGGTVVCCGRREAEGRETLRLVEQAGGSGMFLPLDVKQDSSVSAVRDAAPDDLAQSILFLCSPAASHVTGALLQVDGGFALA